MNPSVKIAMEASDAYNFALQQNQVPIVRKVVLQNECAELLSSAVIRASSDPCASLPWSRAIDLPAGCRLEIDGAGISISPSYLLGLREKTTCLLRMFVEKDGEVIAQASKEISILCFDEWSADSSIPEIIAAFSTPNHPYIHEILKKARAMLSDWGEDPELAGYQSKNPNAILRQMAAIYESIRREGIACLNPPASFEARGQAIRLCGALREEKLGTCLDLTLLYAASLEAAGLNPIIVLAKGRALAACWLEDATFAESVQDDLSSLTKRLAVGINEIAAVEASCLAAGSSAGFAEACVAAARSLKSEEEFLYMVDVARARGGGIHPIRQESSAPEQGAPGAVMPCDLEMHKAPKTSPASLKKQQIWERRLLDLSLRNSLLNFRSSKSAIQLLAHSLPELEDALSGGGEFIVLHKPLDFDRVQRGSHIYEQMNDGSIHSDLIISEYKNMRLRSYLDEAELSAAISALYRSSKNDMEESGANTLYLALGFLKWYESDASQKPRFAPLVLTPVEMVRKSALKGYVIRLRDEESAINITLLEMLRVDFGISISGLDPLPEDQSGIDLNAAFSRIRHAVMGRSRWDVVELAFISTFSFRRFIMWNDIRNRSEDLKRNKIVSSLMSGRMEWQSSVEFPTASELDCASAAELAAPISADASQLGAIWAAGKGASFVLHGPPGTGKSQTITNIIANTLYQGKTVLFVAEKMAALSVVQKRLEAIGLAPFCLELHSNKAQKKEVLSQLERSLSIGRIKPAEDFAERADSLLKLRSDLNDAAAQLHEPRPIGMSLYEAIVKSEQLSGVLGSVPFEPKLAARFSSSEYERWVEACETLEVAAMNCSGVRAHPLRELKNPHYSQALKTELEKTLKLYIEELASLKEKSCAIAEILGVAPPESYSQFEGMAAFSEAISASSFMPASLAAEPDLRAFEKSVKAACETGRVMDRESSSLLGSFSPNVLEADAQTLKLDWLRAQRSGFILKFFRTRRMAENLKIYAKNPKSLSVSSITETLDSLEKYQSAKKALEKCGSAIGRLFGPISIGWDQMEGMYGQALKMRESAFKMGVCAGEIPSCLKSAVVSAGASESPLKALASSLSMSEARRLEDEMEKLLKNSLNDMRSNALWISPALEMAERILQNLGKLRDYCVYIQAREEAEKEGMLSVVDALESGAASCGSLVQAMEKSLLQSFCEGVIEQSKELSKFHGLFHERKIKRFRQLSELCESLTRQELAARLSSQVPAASSGASVPSGVSNASSVSNASEMGILYRAIKSRGRMLSIRKLFESMPNLLRKLAPCMLMSPMSVAQYIDPKFPPFDLVVFDEASQIPTCEAAGAIARGVDLVVVGDPKQLPPTSFFNSMRLDEEDFEKEDLESVLDDCLALSMPSMHLKWHYRSRHESLIAFSNRRYYESSLYTFPSPGDLESKVKLVKVDGYYDRGKTKQNRAEAEAVVNEAAARLDDPARRDFSIGIVTFSLAQQILIADLMDQAFAARPDLDEFNSSSPEPLFIKNLENVQGDERDVILFSIGYGPDERSRLALNFGPLNRDGGWRRLNVAVSRARREMIVFSVLAPSQIDLNKTRSEGLAGLKAFLEFAQFGKSALPDDIKAKKQEPGIEEIVAARIRELGYQADTCVGCSGFRVDIGVINPIKPDEYALGVICDGKRLYQSSTAKDLNVIQEDMLLGLGWRLFRLWSLDWREDPEATLKKLAEAIEIAVEKCGRTVSVPISSPAKPFAPFERIEAPEGLLPAAYRLAALPVETSASSLFANPASSDKIKRQISAILEAEAPISKALLCDRVIKAWGFSKRGPRIVKVIVDNLSEMKMQSTCEGERVFYWHPGNPPENYSGFRVPTDEAATKRALDDISPEELAGAAKHVVDAQVGLPANDLAREVAKLFGISKLSAQSRLMLDAGLLKAVEKGFIIMEGDFCKAPRPLR
ncbi:MAG: DUF3320 domain-containing protein [Clostridiales bacterium]|jgi:hypothetical protein|nr:DUF3320 domain-containing protein [Clostridiales bacterium]